MRYGVTLPNLGIAGGPAALVELGREAEQAGWDGVFVWDAVWSQEWHEHLAVDPERAATWDPWVVLSVLAATTTTIRLGPMVTPPSRRRPWKLAHETATLDRLSNGRLVLPVALGWAPDGAFAKVNEEAGRRLRAERLDEALDILAGLWTGKPFSHDGPHYQVRELQLPASQQQPRIPVWVVALWPNRRSIGRALRWDAILPAVVAPDGSASGTALPDDVAAIRAFADEQGRDATSFDIVVEGNTSRDRVKARDKVRPYADAGATWWLEGVWSFLYEPEGALDRLRARLRAGPPGPA